MSYSAFFYGSLMSDNVLLRVLCGKDATEKDRIKKRESIKIESCILKGYKRSCIKGEDYPGMIKDDNNEVHGKLCKGLNEKDIKSLDTFEGDEYERITVKVNVLNELIEADAYLYIGHLQLLTGEDWSFDYFINSGKEKKWLDNRCDFYEVDKLHYRSQIV